MTSKSEKFLPRNPFISIIIFQRKIKPLMAYITKHSLAMGIKVFFPFVTDANAHW